MSKRDDQSQKETYLKTNRRTFIKTSAAATGAALLGGTLRAINVSASNHGEPNLDEAQFLFVQNAKDVILNKGRLTLIGINPTTIFFSDRPKRIAGHMSTDDFVLDWQEETGKESFHTDPPNAALSVFGEDEVVDVVVILKNPRLVGGALVYDIDELEDEQPIPAGPATLFIDPIGRPLSPTSAAGVHRRHRRRRRRSSW